ncbi:MAG: Fur family transcriptional regulator [Candidatus Uhrbacteria bacterium]|nr:Fur family transcriptional regulator [Candidatus Uhrbacteria bacterium]
MGRLHDNSTAETLRERGLKATPERKEILAVLHKQKHPLTIQEIHSSLRDSSTNQATVYRAMARLVEVGVVRCVDFLHGHKHYELTDAKDHHHLICTKCGIVEDIQGCIAQKSAKAALQTSTRFSRVTGHSFELFGLCKKCDKAPR